jgi:choline transport protein
MVVMTESLEPLEPSKQATLMTAVGQVPSQRQGMVDNLEARELRSRFSVMAAIGIQFSISATPLTVGSYLVFILGAGGSPFFFYAFLVAASGQLLICTCLAEIASVFPHASGKPFPVLKYFFG